MRFPFRIKPIFGIGAVTTQSKQTGPLPELYIASNVEQTASFPEAFRCCPGRSLEILRGNAILLNGFVQTANRELGVPGFQPVRFVQKHGPATIGNAGVVYSHRTKFQLNFLASVAHKGDES